jgi:hypothetical protein
LAGTAPQWPHTPPGFVRAVVVELMLLPVVDPGVELAPPVELVLSAIATEGAAGTPPQVIHNSEPRSRRQHQHSQGFFFYHTTSKDALFFTDLSDLLLFLAKLTSGVCARQHGTATVK